MEHINDDMEIIRAINAQRRREQAQAARKCMARAAHEKAKRAFWRLVRRAVLECGSCLCLAGMMAVYTARDMVSPEVSGPIALACLIVGVWRGAMYWQQLDK